MAADISEPDLESLPGPTLESDSAAKQTPRPPIRMVEQFMGMFTQGSPFRDPLSEKFTPEHIDVLLKIAEAQDAHEFELKKREQDQQTQVVRNLTILAGLTILMIFGICWLFLYFSKVDQVYQILTLLFVGGGGVGVGTGLKRVTRSDSATGASKR